MPKAAAKPYDPDREARRSAASSGDSTSGTAPVAVPLFVLRSPTLREGQTIANVHIYDGAGCTGENLSPALEWSNAPAGTKSFAVTLHDPDPSSEKGWWHWVMYNIPPTVNRLASGAGDPAREFMPGVTHGNTDFGKPGYGGPCPPKGDPPHRYIFSIHALDVDRIEAGENASAASIAAHIRAHWLGSAALTGKYAR